MAIDDELLNRNIGDISSGSNIQDSVGTSTPSDLSEDSATSKKTFTSSAKSKSSNLFGVYETKQVVKEISSRPPQDSAEVQSIDEDSLTSIQNKTGKKITTDEDLEKATANILKNVADQHQVNHDSKFGDSPFTDSNIVASSDGSILDKTKNAKAGDSVIHSKVMNFTNSSELREYIPDSLSTEDFEGLQKTFSNNLKNFNECPDLDSALNYLQRMVGSGRLFDALRKLFGLAGAFDLQGLLNCFNQLQGDLSSLQRKELTDVLIDNGSVNAMKDLTAIGNKGSLTDKYGAVRRMGNNRPIRVSPKTGRTENTWNNFGVKSTTDQLFGQIGADKEQVFSVSKTTTSKNRSITDRSTLPIYDTKAVKKAPEKNGFKDYILGSRSKLLSSIPDIKT